MLGRVGAAVGEVARASVEIGPHAGAHRVALRAGVSVLVPLAVLVLAGRVDLTPYAAFGAMTSLYGRHHGHVDRSGMQLGAATAFTATVGLGVLAAVLPGQHAWLVVLVGALVAGAGQVLADALAWHPPGSTFLVFAFCVCASIPGLGLLDVPLALAVSALSAAFSLLVGHVGVLRDRTGYRVPTLPALSVRTALGTPARRRWVAVVLGCALVGGSACLLVGFEHPYWGIVAAVAALGGADHRTRLVRAVHRAVGTVLGVLVAWPLLAAHPRGLAAVAVVCVTQIGAELFIGRNYALALLFITPLALMMSQLAHEQPVGPLLLDRVGSTAVGAGVSLVAVVALLAARRTPSTPA